MADRSLHAMAKPQVIIRRCDSYDTQKIRRIVREGLETCNETSEDEEDMLDEAPGLTPNSRLACQCVPDGSKDLVVEIPAWNRNMVKEAAH